VEIEDVLSTTQAENSLASAAENKVMYNALSQLLELVGFAGGPNVCHCLCSGNTLHVYNSETTSLIDRSVPNILAS
jgi:hypothetical protein